MTLTRHDGYAHGRIQRDPDFARLMRQSTIDLPDGDDVDRRIARRTLSNYFGMTDDESDALRVKEAAV